MPNPECEYNTARESALKAMAIPNASSCIADALCCDSQVPLVKGDIAVIVNAIKKGQIPSAIIEGAIAKSNDPQRQETCPFLTPERKCSIYDQRPLICIVWGIGGDPLDPKDYIRAVKEYKKGGTDRYPNEHLMRNTCLACHMKTISDSTPIPALELVLSAYPIFGEKSEKESSQSITSLVKDETSLLRRSIPDPNPH